MARVRGLTTRSSSSSRSSPPRVLDATPIGTEAYLETEFRKPFTSNGFGNWFRDRCNEAKLPQCSAHGLRKAGAAIAAENGATEQQMMAIFGWDSNQLASYYAKNASQKKLAAGAMHMLIDKGPSGPIAPPSTHP